MTKKKKGLVATAIFTLVSILYVSPLFIVLMNSFKKKAFINLEPFSLPSEKTFIGPENYLNAVDKYGFLQAVLYIPAMSITKDPFIQYRLMVIINGAVMSLIPIMVYSCSFMLGVKKPWQAVTAAVCTGGWMSCMIHSKFIWNETLAIFIPFLALYLLLKADGADKKSTKKLYSVLLGMTAGLSYCAHQRLFALIAAVSVTLILARFVLKRKTAALGYYFFSLIIFWGLAFFGNYLIQQILWKTNDPAALRNTAENFFASLPDALSDGGAQRFFTALIS